MQVSSHAEYSASSTSLSSHAEYSVSSTLHSCATQQDPNSVEESVQPQDQAAATADERNEMVEMLRDIFPQKQYSELVSVSSECATLQEAIDILLDTDSIMEGNENEGNSILLSSATV